MDKNSIFYSLYYGAVSPWENSNLFNSKEYKDTLTNATELQEKLIAELNDDNKKLLDEFLKTDAKVGSFFEEEKFKDGFILGVRLMIETFTDKRFLK